MASLESESVLNWECEEEDTVVIEQPPQVVTVATFAKQPPGEKPFLYLDLETAPDAERMELFGLPPLPEVAPMMSSAECPDPTQALVGSLDDVEKRLTEWNPDDAYLELVVATEAKAPKPRAGVAKLADKIKGQRAAALNAEADRRKLLSVTPEYCRIVAFGFAFGGSDPGSYITADCELPGGVAGCWSGMSEKSILENIWEKIATAGPIVGYNVLGFDLQVIKVRSALLDVVPSRWLNDSPYGNRDVIDLMLARFGRGGRAMRLKQLAKLYGIPVPAGDTDGSDVERMLAEDPAAIHRYVQSDIEVTRALHRKWSGVFCL